MISELSDSNLSIDLRYSGQQLPSLRVGFSKFNYVFVILLQSLTHFCEFVLHFCHILEIAGTHMNLSTDSWTFIP